MSLTILFQISCQCEWGWCCVANADGYALDGFSGWGHCDQDQELFQEGSWNRSAWCFPSLFCLIPLSCFLCSSALSKKRRHGNLISQHCYILFLGSKSSFFPFAVPCNLATSARLCYKAACHVAGYWQRYCAMKHLYTVQVSVFVLGLKCFALYTCTSHANRPCLCYRLFWWNLDDQGLVI